MRRGTSRHISVGYFYTQHTLCTLELELELATGWINRTENLIPCVHEKEQHTFSVFSSIETNAQIACHSRGLCDFRCGQIIRMGNSSSSLKSRKCNSLPSSPDVKRYFLEFEICWQRKEVQRWCLRLFVWLRWTRLLKKPFSKNQKIESELIGFTLQIAKSNRHLNKYLKLFLSFLLFFISNLNRQKQLPVLYGKGTANGGATSIPLPQTVSVTRRCPPDKIRPLPPTPDQSHSKWLFLPLCRPTLQCSKYQVPCAHYSGYAPRINAVYVSTPTFCLQFVQTASHTFAQPLQCNGPHVVHKHTRIAHDRCAVLVNKCRYPARCMRAKHE